jgi:anti-anti-sigma factor
MGTLKRVFDIEWTGGVMVVIPLGDLRELDFLDIEAGASEVLDRFANGPARDVVVDFVRMDYCGSTALGYFVALRKAVGARGGRLAFCNVSEHEREIMRVARLDTLWSICTTREEAVAAVTARPRLAS